LSVISEPGSEGTNCDFDTLTISLNESRCTIALPNMPNYNLGALAGSECDTVFTEATSMQNFNDIQVYPNPANDVMNIILQNTSGEVNVTFMDLAGQVVSGYTLYDTNEKISLDISNLAAGFYIYTIKGEYYEIATGKFIKL
jgi:hypothetical protein